MALNIKQNTEIKGYRMRRGKDEREVKISQYADDGTLFLSDELQIEAAIKAIDEFAELSGTRLNISKTVRMFLGIDKNRTGSVCGIHFPGSPIKCLGIYVGYDRRLCEESNWQNKLDSVSRLLRSWKVRKITLFGKVTVLKSSVLPKLSHVAEKYNNTRGCYQKDKRRIIVLPMGKA